MLTQKFVTVNEDCTETQYSCNIAVKTDDGCNVTIHSIIVYDYADAGADVHVLHDGEDVYTDNAFKNAVSAALGYDVDFTEQGEQEDGIAVMR